MSALGVEFVMTKTRAEALADTTSGKIYFPTDSSGIIFQGKEYGGGSSKQVFCTLAEYKAMESHDADTYYLITNIDEDAEAESL